PRDSPSFPTRRSSDLVDLRTEEELEQAIANARAFDQQVLLESFHEGQDLRVLVIGYEVVAAALRHPAEVIGDGQRTIRELIEAQDRKSTRLNSSHVKI